MLNREFKELVHEHLALFIYVYGTMNMYLGRIHVSASLPVNYGLLYWAFISGLHVINKWKMCSVRKIVCATYGTGH